MDWGNVSETQWTHLVNDLSGIGSGREKTAMRSKFGEDAEQLPKGIEIFFYSSRGAIPSEGLHCPGLCSRQQRECIQEILAGGRTDFHTGASH